MSLTTKSLRCNYAHRVVVFANTLYRYIYFCVVVLLFFRLLCTSLCLACLRDDTAAAESNAFKVSSDNAVHATYFVFYFTYFCICIGYFKCVQLVIFVQQVCAFAMLEVFGKCVTRSSSLPSTATPPCSLLN